MQNAELFDLWNCIAKINNNTKTTVLPSLEKRVPSADGGCFDLRRPCTRQKKLVTGIDGSQTFTDEVSKYDNIRT